MTGMFLQRFLKVTTDLLKVNVTAHGTPAKELGLFGKQGRNQDLFLRIGWWLLNSRRLIAAMPGIQGNGQSDGRIE